MLSQAEIDALLAGTIEIERSDNQDSVNLAELMGQHNATSKEKTREREVRSYNFWSPDHISKDQIRTVELIHEDLAERLTNSLPSLLRINLRPRVVHTEHGRFHDFLKDLPPSNLYHLINLAPLPGQMVITLSSDISHVILEQRLGGQGEGGQKGRSLTEIDQSLLRGIVENMLNDIKASWNKVAVVEPSLDDSTVNQHWVQMVMGSERVILITFELSMQKVSGTMNVYIPFTMLKPITTELNPHVFFSGRKEQQSDTQARQTVERNLSLLTLPARVLLGTAVLTFKEMIDLRAGDIIKLDTPIQQELPVQVAGRELFLGRIGRSGKNLAIQIVDVNHAAFEGMQK